MTTTLDQLMAELQLLDLLRQMAKDGTTYDEARVQIIIARKCTWGAASDLIEQFETIGNFKFER